MEAVKEFFQYVLGVLGDVYFHRHLAATFFGVLAGFLLSLSMQRRHERKSNRHTRDMYLLALNAELTHNTDLLRELAALNAGLGRDAAPYEPAALRTFYSLLEGVAGRLRFNVFNGIMANGMLGFLEGRAVHSILETYRRLDRLALEIKSSQAWLPQAPGETAELWLERKIGIVQYLATVTGEALEQAESTRKGLPGLLPGKIAAGRGPKLSPGAPHTEISAD